MVETKLLGKCLIKCIAHVLYRGQDAIQKI